MHLENCVVVLNDGETWAPVRGCAIVELTPEGMEAVDASGGMDADDFEKEWIVGDHRLTGLLAKPPAPEPVKTREEPWPDSPTVGQVLPNGAMVLAIKYLPEQPGWLPCDVVLCQGADSTPLYPEWVTWVVLHLDDVRQGQISCIHGHYHNSLSAAVADFEQRR